MNETNQTDTSTPSSVNSPATDALTPKHYFLIAGNVVYKVPATDGEGNPMGIINLNGMITTDSQTLHINDLNKAQLVLQHHFRTKVSDPSLEVADVIILNIVYLGYQSENEFNNLSMGQVQ